jgi:hypothetical protein
MIMLIIIIHNMYTYTYTYMYIDSRKANTCVTSVLDQYCARGRGQNFPRIRLVGGPFMNIMDIHICYTFLWPMRCSTLALGCASSAPSALVAVGGRLDGFSSHHGEPMGPTASRVFLSGFCFGFALVVYSSPAMPLYVSHVSRHRT